MKTWNLGTSAYFLWYHWYIIPPPEPPVASTKHNVKIPCLEKVSVLWCFWILFANPKSEYERVVPLLILFLYIRRWTTLNKFSCIKLGKLRSHVRDLTFSQLDGFNKVIEFMKSTVTLLSLFITPCFSFSSFLSSYFSSWPLVSTFLHIIFSVTC